RRPSWTTTLAASAWLLAAASFAALAWAADPATAADAPPALDDLSARAVEPHGSREGDALRAYLVQDADDEVRVGAELYDRNCSVCHGDTALGFAEAKLAFPADHRTCTRCHRPGNPTQMSFEEMMLRQHDLFDVGAPPALRGPAALERFGDPVALWAYTGATMPRYQPGRLAPTEVRAITVFLWHANGRDVVAATAALAAVAPGPTPAMPPAID
ncbi:MAG: cytochrome c, partial [Trueperaceae bacterium]|nr:cytochrome c [Trueperaceae bacterium]